MTIAPDVEPHGIPTAVGTIDCPGCRPRLQGCRRSCRSRGRHRGNAPRRARNERSGVRTDRTGRAVAYPRAAWMDATAPFVYTTAGTRRESPTHNAETDPRLMPTALITGITGQDGA